jgi:HTH-type transcriptional regulator / antitoxin HipB
MVLRTARDLGALIRDRRRKLRLDQQALADRIGVSRQWVVEIEKGKPRAELGLVLRALGALDVRLTVEDAGAAPLIGAPGPTPAVDIDAIVADARSSRPPSPSPSPSRRSAKPSRSTLPPGKRKR